MKKQMNDINWFHSIKLSNGAITPGKADFESSIKLADIVFSKGLKGKSVLDIGAWDGFFSFEAEKEEQKGFSNRLFLLVWTRVVNNRRFQFCS